MVGRERIREGGRRGGGGGGGRGRSEGKSILTLKVEIE